MNIKILFLKDSSQIIGNVLSETDTTITLQDPCYLMATQQGTQLIPFLAMAGVDDSETEVEISKSDLRFAKLYTPLEDVANGWKDTFNIPFIETPSNKILLG